MPWNAARKERPLWLFLIAGGVILVVFANAFGVSLGMGSRDGDEMAGCPVMGSASALCRMDALEHISRWHQLFTATVPSLTVISLALTLTLLAVFASVSLFENDSGVSVKYRVYSERDGGEIKTRSPLILAFSDGILHPKIY